MFLCSCCSCTLLYETDNELCSEIPKIRAGVFKLFPLAVRALIQVLVRRSFDSAAVALDVAVRSDEAEAVLSLAGGDGFHGYSHADVGLGSAVNGVSVMTPTSVIVSAMIVA